MSEVNKNAANEQEETEKDIPETETVNEPTEESPEATAGQDEIIEITRYSGKQKLVIENRKYEIGRAHV